MLRCYAFGRAMAAALNVLGVRAVVVAAHRGELTAGQVIEGRAAHGTQTGHDHIELFHAPEPSAIPAPVLD